MGEQTFNGQGGGCPVAHASSATPAPAGTAAGIESTARAEAILDVSLTAVITIDTAGIVHSFNPAAERLFGYSAGEMVGASVNHLMPAHHAERHDAYIQRYLAGGEPRIIGQGREEQALHRDGHTFPIYLAVTEYWEGGQRYFVGNLLDLSAVKRAEAELAASRRRYRQLFEESPAPKLLVDPASLAIVAANAAAADFYGFAQRQLAATPLQRLDTSNEARLRRHLEQAARGRLEPIASWHRRADSSLREMELYCGPVQMDEGPQVAMIAMDVTERRLHERQAYRLAYTDPATGLANAAGFAQQADALLADAGSTPAAIALELLDHANVRSALGPDAAETLAERLADRLVERLGAEADIVARIRDGEFALLVPAPVVERAADIALAAAQAPVEVGDQELRVGAVAGIVDTGAIGPDSATLTKRLGVALDVARTAGPGKVRRYAQRYDRTIQDRLAMATELRRALGEGGLTVHYQPQVRLSDGALIGAEALARWPKPEGGYVSPATFIPVAEQAGFIPTLGNWVMEQACAQAALWRAAGRDIGRIAVNVSALQIRHGDLADTVKTVLARTGLPADALELEITESAFLESDLEQGSVFDRLVELGVSLAIDDFGTGYSALAQLNRIPARRLKIDKHFVRQADGGNDAQGTAMIDTITALARVMGTEVLAEGVETAADAAFLARRGCQAGQGFLYGAALPAGEVAGQLPPLRERG